MGGSHGRGRDKDVDMNTEITLPRSIVEQLIDPKTSRYLDSASRECSYCGAPRVYRYWGQETPGDHVTHRVDCPIRIIQERLKETEQ